MIQVCQWIPMHADLARSMPLRFPVQSRSMRGFRAFHAKPQFACFQAFHAKPQVACFRAFASRANAVSGKCGFPSSAAPVESSFPCECCFRASAPVPESYRREVSFLPLRAHLSGDRSITINPLSAVHFWYFSSISGRNREAF